LFQQCFHPVIFSIEQTAHSGSKADIIKLSAISIYIIFNIVATVLDFQSRVGRVGGSRIDVLKFVAKNAKKASLSLVCQRTKSFVFLSLSLSFFSLFSVFLFLSFSFYLSLPVFPFLLIGALVILYQRLAGKSHSDRSHEGASET